uniref:Uncharacterized protein n=1 Tax=Panagrolaimus superbus TaxID=310955 RepID=A0A914Z5Q1_9BILA
MTLNKLKLQSPKRGEDEELHSYYRFIYDAKKKIYACSRCHNFGKSTEAVIKTENDQEIVKADSIHSCEPLPYIEKVKKPDFFAS